VTKKTRKVHCGLKYDIAYEIIGYLTGLLSKA